MNFTRINDFNNLNIQEIQEKINKLKIDILHLKIKRESRQQIKPHILKHKKHQISQLLTLQTQKIKQGVNI